VYLVKYYSRFFCVVLLDSVQRAAFTEHLFSSFFDLMSFRYIRALCLTKRNMSVGAYACACSKMYAIHYTVYRIYYTLQNICHTAYSVQHTAYEYYYSSHILYTSMHILCQFSCTHTLYTLCTYHAYIFVVLMRSIIMR